MARLIKHFVSAHGVHGCTELLWDGEQRRHRWTSSTWGRRGNASNAQADSHSCQVCHRAFSIPAEQIFLKSLPDLKTTTTTKQVSELFLDSCTKQKMSESI